MLGRREKCVAKKVKVEGWSNASFSQMAQQMEAPSAVDVPRPSSSKMTRELAPTLLRM